MTIDFIQQSVSALAEKYDVEKVELFGSFASGQAAPGSDVDFLVKFASKTPSIFKVMGFREELGNTLNRSVDVVTLPLVSPDKLNIERVVRIYERA